MKKPKKKQKRADGILAKRGAGLTKRGVLETENFAQHFANEDWMTARLGREPDWFDWQACAVEVWAEETLRAAKKKVTGEPKPDDPADLALRIIKCGAQTRDAIAKGQADRAAYHAVEFGKLAQTVDIKAKQKDGTAWGKKETRDATGLARDLGEVIRKAYADFEKEKGYKPGKVLPYDVELWNYLKNSNFVDRENGPILYMSELRRVEGKLVGVIELKTADDSITVAFKTFHNNLPRILAPLKK